VLTNKHTHKRTLLKTIHLAMLSLRRWFYVTLWHPRNVIGPMRTVHSRTLTIRKH